MDASPNGGDEKYINELCDYADIVKYETYTVMNALKSLKRLNYLNPSAASTLLNDAAYGNNRLNPVVNEVISYFYEQNNYRKMLKDEFNKLDASKKDKLKDIIK